MLGQLIRDILYIFHHRHIPFSHFPQLTCLLLIDFYTYSHSYKATEKTNNKILKRNFTVLQTYAVSIFQMLKAPIDKYYATLILGVLQIVGAGTCVLLVHYTGKRPLTLFSTSGAGICCILVAIYDIYIKTVRNDV